MVARVWRAYIEPLGKEITMKRIILGCLGAQMLALAAGCSQLTTVNQPSNGTPIDPAGAELTITITDSTRYVNVYKFDTVKFIIRGSDGRESVFGWRFDTFSLPDPFPLSDIAPAGVSVPRSIQVYVARQPIPLF
jgi:hypothetical protein